ncbi:hypothetical protein CHS0354_020444 [Potamilus streckersoni]|uniref:Mitochondria-eating protein C-terminal domain-containing protein n=1 Tax=Potamilus streckersoni TaxID=2493646 RepID=A0AAE0W9G1_9BIVA|nr:hypothetical protein CHS0354_020444 [Potamilus streckersoni]
MEATVAPSYLRLFQDTDFSGYSEDKLNKINSEFMKDYQKLKGIVQFSSIWFGSFIQKIRSKNFGEAEEYRKNAHGDCEMLLEHLVRNGLRSEHQQKQDSQCANCAPIYQSSTEPVQEQAPLKSNARKPKIGDSKDKPRTSMKTFPDKQKSAEKEIPGRIFKSKKKSLRSNTGDRSVNHLTGISNQHKQFQVNAQEQKRRESQEQILKSQQKTEIAKKNSRSGKIDLVSNSTGNASKTLAKPVNLQVNPVDNLVHDKNKNSYMNAMKPTPGESKEYISNAKQITGIAMTNNIPGKTEMAPTSAINVHRTTITNSVQNSNTHQSITEGHLYHKDSGKLDATGRAATESDILRRSEEASLLLVQGNPNIADLSDSNRPTKLAERYSELYSNEYTDAFEELKMKEISERDIIQTLLNILVKAYIYCQRKAKNETTRIEAEIDFKKQGYKPENAETLWKAQIAKSLKESGLKIKGNICQNFIGEELPKILRPSFLPIGKKLSTYATLSVEIVWMMCLQDPPLCIKSIEDKNTLEEFDTSLFRFYTRSGKYMEYCVWPVLLLYDGGPLLAKGVAQGK